MNINLKFLTKLKKFQILSNENLTQNLCSECVNEVIRSFLFRKKAINANTKLREKLKESGNYQQNFENTNAIITYEEKTDTSQSVSQSINDDDSNSYLEFFKCSELPEELFSTNDINHKLGKNNIDNQKVNSFSSVKAEDIRIISTGRIETIDGDEIYIESEIPPIDMKPAQPMPIQTENGFQCPYCMAEFKNRRRTKVHMNNVHLNKKKYKPLTTGRLCPICGETSNSISTYSDHYRKHFPELLHYCRFCNKAFAKLYYCKMHEKIHTNEKPFLCDRCEYSCITNSQLKVSAFLNMSTYFKIHIS